MNISDSILAITRNPIYYFEDVGYRVTQKKLMKLQES